MLSLLNVLAAKKNLNAVLKGAVFFAFFSFFSFGVFGQCNNLNVSLGLDIEVCNGANVTTANPYVFTSGSCGYSVQGNNCIPNSQNVFYAYVIATNACSESCANSTAITVDTPPTAAFTINPTTACTNTNVTVTSNVISGTDIGGSASQGFTCATQANIKWSITPNNGFTLVNGSLDGNSSTYLNWSGSNVLTLNFSVAGTYTITQNVQSNAGCGTAIISHTICVVDPPMCAFTPSPLSGCTVLPVTINNTTTGPSCGTPSVPLALSPIE